MATMVLKHITGLYRSESCKDAGVMRGCYKCKQMLMSYVTACTSIHQKAFEQGASNVCLCGVAAAFAAGGACVLVL